MSSLLGLLMRTLPRWIYLIFCFVLFFKSASIHSKLQAQQPDRVTTSLNGAWHFYRENDADKKVVNLPTHWETHEGLKFDGTGYYEKTIELPVLNSGRRLLLHFDTVATHATVYWNNKRIGEHLGGWTPFRFDVTDYVNAPPHGALPAAESSNKGEKSDTSKITSKHTIKIHVDEKVGHNTQGFLPIIAPHFGGIWQGIKLIEVPEVYIDDLRISINSNHITIPIVGTVSDANVTFAVFPISNSISNQPVYTWNSGNSSSDKDQNGRVTIPHNFRYEAWSADQPKLYRVVIHLKNGDSVTLQTGFRSIETDADKFLLNKHTLTIRGVLNWGYYPPSLAPTPSEQQWREDIQLIKRWGFNLMKCCLWVPSKRLLEIADEEGIYLWIEYPTWHPKLTPEYQSELLQEYREFHELDRNHPSVILRSLTCETGPGADIKVIQALYDQCKLMCGGLVVDDSSWIEWNRVFDFYDDHPYGNNHTWIATLDRLKKYISNSKYGVKPLCLGEAIAADTWVPTKSMLDAIAKAKADPAQAWSLDERGYPFWVPGFFDANQKWLERMSQICGGPVDEARLHQDSLRYAWLMRKYQMNTFRKEVPHGGYVVSVLRDFPLASMGLLDYHHVPKWADHLWKWHGNLKSEPDSNYPPFILGPKLGNSNAGNIRIAQAFDTELLDYLEAGGKVLLQPNNGRGSLPLQEHWFLRGAPFVHSRHPLIQKNGQLHNLLIDQQHFWLAGRVIPDLQYLEEIDPILMLWDNHDIKQVKTHGLVFETKVGKGRLLVSALHHSGDKNELGSWLLQEFINHLETGPEPRNKLKPESITRIRAKLNEKKLELTNNAWQFLPDSANSGLKLGYEKADFDDSSWKPIKIGQHWEGQGYPALDGWAWYRIKIDIPGDWLKDSLFLNTEGIDDAYEIYFNGKKMASGGDMPRKLTAFDERKAHTVPHEVINPDGKNVIAIRVFDWYGAGGIHRPITISNVPVGGIDIIK